MSSFMIPRIRQISVLNNDILWVKFDDGHKVMYDVKDDIATIPSFRPLREVYGLSTKYRWIQAAPACIGTTK